MIPRIPLFSAGVAPMLLATLAFAQSAFDPSVLGARAAFEAKWRFSPMNGAVESGRLDDGDERTAPLVLVQRHTNRQGLSAWIPAERENAQRFVLVNGLVTAQRPGHLSVQYLFRTEGGVAGDGGVHAWVGFYDAEGRNFSASSETPRRSDGRYTLSRFAAAIPSNAAQYELRLYQRDLAGESRLAILSIDHAPMDANAPPRWCWKKYELDDAGLPRFLAPDVGSFSMRTRAADTATAPAADEYALHLDRGDALGLEWTDASRWGRYRFSLAALAKLRGTELEVRFETADGDRRPVRRESRKWLLGKGNAFGTWESNVFDIELSGMDAAVRPVLLLGKTGDAQVHLGRMALSQETARPLSSYLGGKEGGGAWKASWICAPSASAGDGGTNSRTVFRRRFDLPDDVRAVVFQAAVDDSLRLFFDGKPVLESRGWNEPARGVVTQGLKPGPHVFAAEVTNNAGPMGFLFEAEILRTGCDSIPIHSDRSWMCTQGPDVSWTSRDVSEKGWAEAFELGKSPLPTWGEIPYARQEERSAVAIESWNAPDTAQRSEALSVEVRVSGLPAEGASMGQLELVQSNAVLAVRRAEIYASNRSALRFDFALPDWLEAGPYALRLRVPGTRLIGGAERALRLEGKPPARAFPRMQVAVSNGISTVLRDGKPFPFAQAWHPGAERLAAMESTVAGGVSILQIDLGDLGWKGEGQFDYAEIHERIQRALLAGPDVHLALYAPLDTSRYHGWWVAKYPEALARDGNGREIFVSARGLSNKAPSFASARFRGDFGEALRRLVSFIAARPYAERIAMIQPASGLYGEWHQWGSSAGIPADYSPASRDGFRRFLRERYASNRQAFAAAWGPSGLDFDKAELAGARERTNQSASLFLDPVKERRLIDSAAWQLAQSALAIEHFCRTVKEASGGRLLTGVRYGFLLNQNGGLYSQLGAQLDLRRLLDSPHVDVFLGLSDGGSAERVPGGTGGFIAPVSSFPLHGKLWIQEADHRSFWDASAGRRGENHLEDLAVLRREFCLDLAWGAQPQYTDRGRFYQSGDPRLAAECGRLARLGAAARQAMGEVVPQVAVWFDDQSLPLTAISESNSAILSSALWFFRSASFRSGVRCDLHALADLERPGFLPAHRVHVFPNNWLLTPTQRKLIREKILRPGNTAVFLNGAGYFTHAMAAGSAANIEGLVGMKMREWTNAALFQCRALPGAPNWVPASSGVGRRMAPWFSVEDASATPLSAWVESSNGVAMAETRMGGARILHLATPSLSSTLLRELARQAGLLISSEGDDAVYPAGNFLGIHTRSAGEKALRATGSEAVELFSGRTFAIKDGSFSFPADAKTTYLFYSGAGASRLLEALRR